MKVKEVEKKYQSHCTSRYIVSRLAASLDTLTPLVPDPDGKTWNDFDGGRNDLTATTITTITTISLRRCGRERMEKKEIL